MMKKFFLLTTSIAPLLLCAQDPVSPPKRVDSEITVNNRVLLMVNGKPLTVVDVVKKMDLVFYRQYPHLLNLPMARYEFYMTNFQPIFSTLVNDLLIEADAEEKEVALTEGEIREELEGLFGPTVVENIDKLGLSYEEAWDLIKRELIVKRMTQMMVRSKAMTEIQPKELKVLYNEYLKKNPPEKEWNYQIVTVKGIDSEMVESVARRVFIDLLERRIGLSQIATILREEQGVDITVSDAFVRKEKEISAQHKKILEALSPQNFSHPVVQKNQSDGTSSARIFFLNELKDVMPISFNELEGRLHNELLQRAVGKQGEIYAQRLRERYGINVEYLSQMIPFDFQPFAMR